MFKWPDGRVYSGWWQDGKQHGEGVYSNPKGIRRKGMWDNGERKYWIQKD